ncbi:MAG: fused MFS/spermidine synthase [Pseudomonadota bacterium]
MAAIILWTNVYADTITPTIIYLKIVAGLAALILIISIMDKRPLFVMACLAMIFANPTIPYIFNQNIVDITRNYFGTLIVEENKIVRTLSHGDTVHGIQALDKSLAIIPLSYYYPKTANGEVLAVIEKNVPHAKIAALGLGGGSVACLFKPDNFIDFYEIDPNVVSIVETKKHFTYLSECKTPYKIIIGDARLNIQKADDNLYDIVFVDVFSGDNIPMHLITKQAANIYLHKTKKDGVVLFHISNRFFNLRRELGYIARDLNTQAFYHLTTQGKIENTSLTYSTTHSVLLTNNEKRIEQLKKLGWKKIETKNDNIKAWTDDFSTPLRAITFGVPQ